jgi:hypothetical protein
VTVRKLLTVVDGAVSLRNLTMTRGRAATLLKDRGPVGEALITYLNSWLDRQPTLAKSITGSPDAWPVWDCGTAAAVMGLAKSEIRVRPRLRDDRRFEHPKAAGTIRWVTSIDSDRLWTDLAARVDRR